MELEARRKRAEEWEVSGHEVEGDMVAAEMKS
eukprot:CAMPEP_0115240160 /NCGR_PEP_ID=MMETSP0270-20121206/37768_1 /TAXON_ID=71861 /ORGANISM="Scrippsiella trochoidea, Strain CCMP3099" /LENGTH=31 /DNA_ID= /DNA_START= /DNA_END= /DNA_ORIENTATION=